MITNDRIIAVLAVYEKRMLRPLEPIALRDGARVRIFLTEDLEEKRRIFKQRYPESFGVLSREDAEELMRIIDEEFGKVDPEEWS